MIDNNPAMLDEGQRQRLKVLLSSQALDDALDKANAERADKRAAALAKVREAHSTQEAAEAAAEREAIALRARAEAAHLAWLKAANAHAEAVAAASQARHLHNTATRRAQRELAELGGETIDRTQHACRLAWSQAMGAQDWYFRGGGPGREKAEPRHPTLPEFIAALIAWIDELEAMRLSDMTPADIDARCVEIRGEIDARQVPPEKDGKLRTIASWVGPTLR